MTTEQLFAAFRLAMDCPADEQHSLPCPEAFVLWNGQEGCLHVDPQAYLARCRRRWEQGKYYPAIGFAVRFCTHNELALPDWLGDAVHHATLCEFENGGRTGNRREGGHLKRARQQEVHRQRWVVASSYIRLRAATYDQTWERTSEDLRSTEARGSPSAIRRSYYKMQNQLKIGPVKSPE